MNKQMIFSIIIFALIGFTNLSFGGGFPVFDGAAALDAYAQLKQLEAEYDELLLQGKNIKGHYDKYKLDFEILLKQVEKLRSAFSDGEWIEFIEYIESFHKYYMGKFESAIIADMDTDSPTYDKDLDVVLGEYGEVPRKPEEIEADVKDMKMWTPVYEKEAERDYVNYNRHKDKMGIVAENKKNSDARKKEILAHNQVAQNLGDKSDLKTQQAIAFQNLTIMKQNEEIIKLLNQQLLLQDWESSKEYSKNAEERENQIKKLKNRKPTGLYGDKRFGNF